MLRDSNNEDTPEENSFQTMVSSYMTLWVSILIDLLKIKKDSKVKNLILL